MKSFIFKILLWIVTRINMDMSHRLMVWGLRDGAFPLKKEFDPALGVDLWGKHFKNPIGVAAGIDKRGNVIDPLIEMGWGFGEFGSYTLEGEYPDKDIMYINKDKSILIHSAGYRNPGLATITPVLAARRRLPHIVGVNIASTSRNESGNIKYGSLMSYEEEFSAMAARVAPYCDYIALNLAHPDCELYRMITDENTVGPVIRAVKEAVQKAAPLAVPKVVVKIPPDLRPAGVKEVASYLLKEKVDGVIIAGNLNLDPEAGYKMTHGKRYGGLLSGKPLYDKVLALIGEMRMHTDGQIPIIAAGGIFTAADAFEAIKAGATLIQINTAITYKGPNVVNVINKELVKMVKARGYKTIIEAVGKV